MVYTKKKKDVEEFDYHIENILGTIAKNEKSNWGKYICVARNGDDPTTIDIRYLKINPDDKDDILIGKGMSLNGFEIDKLTDLMLSNGFGTTQALEEELERRKRMYGLEEKEKEDLSDE